MKICIQDPVVGSTYVLSQDDLEAFVSDPDDYTAGADILFVIPTDQLVQELPATRLSDAADPTVQIISPDANRSWIIPAGKLDNFLVDVPPSDDDVVWFAMPSARDLIAAVPIFRKALVQHSS